MELKCHTRAQTWSEKKVYFSMGAELRCMGESCKSTIGEKNVIFSLFKVNISRKLEYSYSRIFRRRFVSIVAKFVFIFKRPTQTVSRSYHRVRTREKNESKKKAKLDHSIR